VKITFSSFEDYFSNFNPHMCFYGFNGTGKTSFAGRTGLRTIELDCGDAGVVTLKGAKNIKIVRIRSIAHYLEVVTELNNREGQFDLLIPDTLTGLQSLAIREVKGKGKNKKEMNQRLWGQVGSMLIECIHETSQFPGGVIYLAQERRKSKKGDEGFETFAPSLTPGVREFLSSKVDWIGRLYLDGDSRKVTFKLTDLIEAKDRVNPPVFPKDLKLGNDPLMMGEAYLKIRERIVKAVSTT
jgi:phage nucleotide-binding protein